jgi:cytochrome c
VSIVKAAVCACAIVMALSAAVRAGGRLADPAHGEQVHARCLACHALASDRVGPRHCGLIGRRAGSVPGFDYSPAMKSAGFVWNAARLDRFLTRPLTMLPGTSMTYDGVPDALDRADLIAYLAQVDRSPACARVAPASAAASPPLQR